MLHYPLEATHVHQIQYQLLFKISLWTVLPGDPLAQARGPSHYPVHTSIIAILKFHCDYLSPYLYCPIRPQTSPGQKMITFIVVATTWCLLLNKFSANIYWIKVNQTERISKLTNDLRGQRHLLPELDSFCFSSAFQGFLDTETDALFI